MHGIQCWLHDTYLPFKSLSSSSTCPLCMVPRELTFTWWGCYGLCLRHNPTELAHSFYSVLVSVSVFMVLSTVFHSINSPDNSPLSHSVLPVLFLPYWSIRLYIYISLGKSPPAPLWLTRLKAPTN